MTVWKMCTIEYHWDYNSYGYRIFVSIDRITSDIVGVFIDNGWVQTGASANIVYGGLGTDVVVHGYGYIGVDIKGFPTAIRIPDTWYWYFTMRQY
ncbi:hypothetical protein KVG29_00705 [Caldicoprobacter algeriensis]|uniref:hypothetical protein n=1 Tax=Caldicoprobacter algeriensis TaxID=699281 RepID=UPI002079AA1E|nr:hypothetical protein [Caldicoprobacter algeriensis]MCM8899743.1 hypothetical protein [Caldicoprobacter algeriensis]